jgi:hypothetical protein
VKRLPIAVILVSLLFITAGAIGIVYHFKEVDVWHPLVNHALWLELVRLLAIVAGVFMLRGSNWARWLALAWISFHVVISVFHSLDQLVMHAVLMAVITYCLFRQDSREYFRAIHPKAGL